MDSLWRRIPRMKVLKCRENMCLRRMRSGCTPTISYKSMKFKWKIVKESSLILSKWILNSLYRPNKTLRRSILSPAQDTLIVMSTLSMNYRATHFTWTNMQISSVWSPRTNGWPNSRFACLSPKSMIKTPFKKKMLTKLKKKVYLECFSKCLKPKCRKNQSQLKGISTLI